MEEQPKLNQNNKYQFEFSGSGSEYFKIWIVNILLTIVTLYIYSAWAKVRKNRYFYGNTSIDGSAFEYHAKGIQLLPGRLIGLALIIMIAVGDAIFAGTALIGYALLFLLMPWAICRSTAFNTNVSSFRNVRFGFDGKASRYYKYMFLLPLIPIALLATIAAALYFTKAVPPETLFALIPIGVFALYGMFPLIQGKISAYSIGQSKFGTANFETTIQARKFYSYYIKMVGMGVVIMLAVMVAIGGLIAISGESLQSALAEESTASAGMMAMLGVGYLLMMLGATFMRSYYRTRLRNYQFNNTVLDGDMELQSTISVKSLWVLEFTNLLLVVFTLGLAYPWVAVRTARFMAANTYVNAKRTADHFISDQGHKVSAVGEEIGDAFDMDIAAGF